MINVNLLPPDMKDEITMAKRNRRSVSNYWKTLWIVILVAAIFAGSAYWLWQRAKSYDAGLTQAQEAVDEYKNLEVKASKEQDKLTKIKAILSGSNKWSNVLSELDRIKPAGVAMTNLRLDAAKNSRQSITGDAPSRDTVIAFKDALEASKLFRYVDIDSTVTKTSSDGSGVGENFVISFSLEDGALK